MGATHAAIDQVESGVETLAPPILPPTPTPIASAEADKSDTNNYGVGGRRMRGDVIRVLIAEDMHMVRGALVALLNLEQDVDVVAEVDRKSVV